MKISRHLINLAEALHVHVLHLWFLDNVGSFGLRGGTLGRKSLLAFVGLSLEQIVCLDAFKEGSSRLRLAHMLDAHMDALRDDSLAHWLVDNHSNRVRRHVEHTAGLSVVELMRQALLDGAVSDHVDDVADLVVLHVDRDCWQALLTESLGEEVASSSSVSESVRHFPDFI